MSTLKKLLVSIAKNADLQENNDFQEFLEKNKDKEVMEAELPVEIYNVLLKHNFNHESAINNPDIKKHFTNHVRGEFYGLADNRIKRILKENGIEDEKIKEILAIKDYFDRLPATVETLQTKWEAEAAEQLAQELSQQENSKQAASQKESEEALQAKSKQINELAAKNKELERMIAEELIPKSDLEALQAKHQQEKVDHKVWSQINQLRIASNFDEKQHKGIRELIFANLKRIYPNIGIDEKENQLVVKDSEDESLLAQKNGRLLTFEDALKEVSLVFLAKHENDSSGADSKVETSSDKKKQKQEVYLKGEHFDKLPKPQQKNTLKAEQNKIKFGE